MKTLLILVFFTFCSFNISLAGDIAGKVKTKDSKNIGNAVIYVDNISGKSFPIPDKHAIMDQKNLTFIPHVLPIVTGTTVDFLNSDDVLHNVFTSDGCANNFNLGSWPKGEIRTYTFNNPGCFAVMLCNVHPEMEAYVISIRTPYYAVGLENGSYKIKDIPAGTYTLKIWHEKYQGSDLTVVVPEKGEVTVNFILSK